MYEGQGQAQNPELEAIILASLTPEYTKLKTEEVIDAGYFWITDASTNTPSVSFPEIKEQVLKQNPQLLSELTAMSQELQSQSVPEEMNDEELAQFEQMRDNSQMLITFVENDFSLPLDTYLQGVKGFYSVLKIVLPVLIIVLILCLIILLFGNKSLHSRLTWIGTTLMLSAISGFVVIAFQTILLSFLVSTTTQSSNDLSSLFVPIATEIMQNFVKTFTNYQGIMSVILLVLSAIFFAIASLSNIKKPALQPVLKTKKK